MHTVRSANDPVSGVARWSINHAGDVQLLRGIASGVDTSRETFLEIVGKEIANHLEEQLGRAAHELLDARSSAPFRHLLNSCVTSAQTVVLEFGYFDIDTRSEYAAALVRKFAFAGPSALRVHFFNERLLETDFADAIRSGGQPSRIADSYLGYTIIRQSKAGVLLGRTLIQWPDRGTILDEPQAFGHRVRTKVSELVELSGLVLTARGMPFIQQDGEFNRCAHAAVWMAHYISALRGLARRVPFAEIAEHSTSGRVPLGGALPSPGLTDGEILASLQYCGLPATCTYRLYFESAQRSLRWHDRPALREASVAHPWELEYFTTTICRYLNSGLPVLITLGGHVLVVIGYIRAREIEGGDPTDSSVHSLIVHDDSDGPYLQHNVNDVLQAMDLDDAIIIPVPPGLSLAGDAAESLGITALSELVERNLPSSEPGFVPFETISEKMKIGHLTARTYACDASDFKQSFARRCKDPAAVSQVLTARLPKYVWIVEMIERDRRDAGQSPVIGEAIIDGTAASLHSAEVLVLHLPGVVLVKDRYSGLQAQKPCASTMYDSGRWAQNMADMWDEASLQRRVKLSGTVR